MAVRVVLLSMLVATAWTACPATGQAAAIRAGQSGWFWQSPIRQGFGLVDVDFAGSRGYAVGQRGTVLRSDDAGETWSGLVARTSERLDRVEKLGEASVLVGGSCALRRSDDGGRTFRVVRFAGDGPRCGSGLQSFSFPTPELGYVLLENGRLLKTDDGGRSFATRSPIPTTRGAGGGELASDLHFGAGGVGLASTDERIYRTVDDGRTWTVVAAGLSGVRDLEPVTAETGYALDRDTLLRTDDGGMTWAERPLLGASPWILRSVRCGTPDECIITTGGYGPALRTSDGGATAMTQPRRRALCRPSPTRLGAEWWPSV